MVDSDMVINYELVEEAKSCSNCRYRYCYIGANKPMCINQSVVTAAKNYKFNSKSLCNEEENNRIFDAINLYNVVFITPIRCSCYDKE